MPLKLGIAGALYFYPRPPRGGRPGRAGRSDAHHSISIHALREEGDHTVNPAPDIAPISIHALREEGDLELLHFLC